MTHVPAPDIVKLTAHFAERERTGHRFLAEALLDLCADRGIGTSIMQRGIASFGPRKIVRSDESLSLSEDLPVLISAVDEPDAVAALTDGFCALMTRGMLTLERARSVDTGLRAATQPVKLTVYLGRQERMGRQPAYEAACAIFHRLGFLSATAFLGVDGTVRGQRRRARFLSRNVDVPMFVTAIGTPAQAAQAAAELAEALDEPLLTVERVQVCKRDGQVFEPPGPADEHTKFQKLTVITSEDSQFDGIPIHRALVRQLRDSRQVSGTTVLRGLWGFHGRHRPHGDNMFRLGRRVPVATMVVDTPDVIAAVFAIADRLTDGHGLVTCERVPAMLEIDGDGRRGGASLTSP